MERNLDGEVLQLEAVGEGESVINRAGVLFLFQTASLQPVDIVPVGKWGT